MVFLTGSVCRVRQAPWEEYPPPALQALSLMSMFLRAKQAPFYAIGEVGAEAQQGQLVKILIHSLFALLNPDALTQDNSP